MTYPVRVMTSRARYEAACHAALARYKQAIADGTWRVHADNALVDALLKAADKFALAALDDHISERVIQAIADSKLAPSRRETLDDAVQQASARRRKAAAT